MALDTIEIGERIRKIREELYKETRQNFAERCGLQENHLGKIERGEILISTKTLYKICSITGTESDYILFGKGNNKNLSIRRTMENFLDGSSKEEIESFFRFLSIIKSKFEPKKK